MTKLDENFDYTTAFDLLSEDVVQSWEVDKALEQFQESLIKAEAGLPADEPAPDDIAQLRRDVEALASLRGRFYSPQWRAGISLVSEEYFADYAEDAICEGDGISADSFIYNYVNWDQAVDAYETDWQEVSVELDGTTYTFLYR